MQPIPAQLFADRQARRLAESDEAYPSIQLSPHWRVIRCPAAIQWILQYRASAETYSTAIWRGRSYCRTRDALIRCCNGAGEIDPATVAALQALPERIGEVRA